MYAVAAGTGDVDGDAVDGGFRRAVNLDGQFGLDLAAAEQAHADAHRRPGDVLDGVAVVREGVLQDVFG